jgi:hypothetical protein
MYVTLSIFATVMLLDKHKYTNYHLTYTHQALLFSDHNETNDLTELVCGDVSTDVELDQAEQCYTDRLVVFF